MHVMNRQFKSKIVIRMTINWNFEPKAILAAATEAVWAALLVADGDQDDVHLSTNKQKRMKGKDLV